MDMDFAAAGERRAGEAHGLGMEVDRTRLAQIRQTSAAAAQELIRTRGAEAAAAERATLEPIYRKLAIAYKNKDLVMWDRVNDELGEEYANVPIEEAEYLIAAFDATMLELAGATASDARASLNPIWGTGPNDEPAVFQLSEDGRAIKTEFPEGYSPNRGTEKIDTGTEILLYDPTTREIVGRQPKDVAGAAAQGAVGTAAGNVAATIGGTRVNVQSAVDQIARIVESPALPRVTGTYDARLPAVAFGQESTDLIAQIDGLSSKAFVNAIESLKGLGAMSEMEAKAATDSVANLTRAQSPEAFKAELGRMQTLLTDKLAVAEQMAARANGGAAPAVPPPPDGSFDLKQLPTEVLAELGRSPPGTMIEGPNGERLIWDGQRLTPAR
jgi:hypothetical protein